MGNHFFIQIASLQCLTSIYIFLVNMRFTPRLSNIQYTCFKFFVEYFYLVYSKYDKLQISPQTNYQANLGIKNYMAINFVSQEANKIILRTCLIFYIQGVLMEKTKYVQLRI
jgi:hypothetical protein